MTEQNNISPEAKPSAANTAANNKRIAKNTLYLYSRTFISILITLYTSRVFLNQLGIEDYGIYNLVGGVVSLFAVLNSMLAGATQRFLNIEIGKGDIEKMNKTFNISVTIHVLIAILFLLVGELGGLILLKYFLKIPEGKEYITYAVFHFSMITAVVSLFRVPYNALIIAKERMSFFAIISIFEVTAKLILTLSLALIENKLIYFSIAFLFVNVVLVLLFYLYCKLKISLPAFKFYSFKNNIEYKNLLVYSGWSLVGTSSSVARDQGISFLLNSFFGVVLNAAMGIVVQISNVLSGLFLNLQTAFRPQIIQASVNDRTRYTYLFNLCSFYSLALMGLICVPFILSCEQILTLWLGIIPDYTVVFVQLLLVKILFASISQSVYLSLEAVGKIKEVQLCTTVLSAITIIISYFLLKFRYEPYWVMGANILMEVLMFIYRLYIGHRYHNVDIKLFLKQNLPLIVSTFCFAIIAIYLSSSVSGIKASAIAVLSSLMLYSLLVVLLMDKTQRKRVLNKVSSKFYNVR